MPARRLFSEMRALLTAAERVRHDLATEHGMMAADATAPTSRFKMDHRKTVRALDRAMKPLAGSYDATMDPR